MKIAFRILSVSAALSATFATAHAQETRPIEPPPLPIEVIWRAGESSQNDGWYNLTRLTKEVTLTRNGETQKHIIAGNSGFPLSVFPGGTWPHPINSQLPSNESSTAALSLKKGGEFGTPSPADDSLYFGSMSLDDPLRSGGELMVSSNAIDGLNTILFQVSIGAGQFYDFDSSGFPMLTLKYMDDSSSTAFVPHYDTIIEKAYNGAKEVPSGPGGELEDVDVFINLYGFQWDVNLFGDGGVVKSFEITFGAVDHAQLYYMQLDQSSGIYNSAYFIPEPTTYALLLGASVLGLIAVRRRRRS